MSNENAENIQNAPVAPAPAPVEAPAKAPADVAVAAPVVSPTEKQDAKVTAAFIKMRQENRELKAKQAAAPVITPSPATPADPVAAPQTTPEVHQAPAPVTAVESIEAESAKAISDMGKDAELAAIPGAIIDLVELVDSDPRLARLHSVDPILAFREGKAILMGKYGIAPAPDMPKSAPTSGGISGGSMNLESLIAECQKHRPGTREYTRLANLVNAEMRKQG